jgi:hypothetical protein
MFPDTAAFTDPAYSDPNYALPTDASPGINVGVGTVSGQDLGNLNPWGVPDWSGIAPSSGGSSSNTPVQSSTTGSSLLGWLGLGSSIAQTVTSATRSGAGTRPGVNKPTTTSLGMFGTVSSGSLFIVIVVAFIGAIFLLLRK